MVFLFRDTVCVGTELLPDIATTYEAICKCVDAFIKVVY